MTKCLTVSYGSRLTPAGPEWRSRSCGCCQPNSLSWSATLPLQEVLIERTEGNDDPDKIHQEIIHPEVIGFRAAVGPLVDVVIEEAGGVIQRIAVEMAHADNHLERMLQGVPIGGQPCNNKAKWSPQELELVSGTSLLVP